MYSYRSTVFMSPLFAVIVDSIGVHSKERKVSPLESGRYTSDIFTLHDTYITSGRIHSS